MLYKREELISEQFEHLKISFRECADVLLIEIFIEQREAYVENQAFFFQLDRRHSQIIHIVSGIQPAGSGFLLLMPLLIVDIRDARMSTTGRALLTIVASCLPSLIKHCGVGFEKAHFKIVFWKQDST